jgi:hypothetical protein
MIPIRPSDDEEIQKFKAQFKQRYPNANLPPPNPNKYPLSAPADDDENPDFNRPNTIDYIVEEQEVNRVLFKTEDATLTADDQISRFAPQEFHALGAKRKKGGDYDRDDDDDDYCPAPIIKNRGPPPAPMPKPKGKPDIKYKPYS